jgi:hypothetical protein
MYRFVLLMPGAMTVTGFEVTAFPLPNSPIWLNGEGLQVGGWQAAVIDAAPGKMGVTDPVAAGIVVGVVDSNSNARPVRIVPFLSIATDVIGCVLFGFTETLVEVEPPPVPGTINEIEVGGHVEKKPAELPALAIFAVITVDPGCCAVATPFWSIVTTEGVCAT